MYKNTWAIPLLSTIIVFGNVRIFNYYLNIQTVASLSANDLKNKTKEPLKANKPFNFLFLSFTVL